LREVDPREASSIVRRDVSLSFSDAWIHCHLCPAQSRWFVRMTAD